jgi:hypothetical protein
MACRWKQAYGSAVCTNPPNKWTVRGTQESGKRTWELNESGTLGFCGCHWDLHAPRQLHKMRLQDCVHPNAKDIPFAYYQTQNTWELEI